MIQVEIHRAARNQAIHAFRVSGHANYAKHGEDIVCSAVSVVTVGTVNAIEKLLGVELVCRMKDGFLSADIPVQLIDESSEQSVQLLLESMLVMLESVQESYAKYISIEQLIM